MARTPAEPVARSDELTQTLEAWVEAAVARSGLSVRDVRRGVQSVSSVYVESRGKGRIGARATESKAKRAALSTYYAPLHFLAAHHVVEAIGSQALGRPERIVDLGCGTAACGVAVARALDPERRATGLDPERCASVLGLDRSGWLLAEARHTFAAFGVAGRTRRANLPQALPRLGESDLAVVGYLLNELDASGREILLRQLASAVSAGARLLILEPLSGAISPWWETAVAALAPLGVRAEILKFAIDRPQWIEAIDTASRLDHREIGARVLFGPAG